LLYFISIIVKKLPLRHYRFISNNTTLWLIIPL
jgi:hypothetical protein